MRKASVIVSIAIILGSMLWVSACSTQSLFAPDDKAIVGNVQAKLFQDSVLKTRDIRVTSDKGSVALAGTVATELEKSAAEHLASEISGVRHVDNQLMVSSATKAQAAPAATGRKATEQSAMPATQRPATRQKDQDARRARKDQREAKASNASSPQTEATNAATNPPINPAPAVQPVAAAPPPQPIHVTIPVGTTITVRMIDDVDSSRDHAGQEFTASVESPVVVGERVVIPGGSDARVRLVNAHNAGHMSGRSELQLELSGVTVAGTNYDADSTTYSQLGASRGKRTAETVGGGAVLGGLIGAIAGHGKGAAIGSVIGAGAGAAAEAGTKAAPMRVPSETKIDFTLKAPLDVILPPRSSKAREAQ